MWHQGSESDEVLSAGYRAYGGQGTALVDCARMMQQLDGIREAQDGEQLWAHAKTLCPTVTQQANAEGLAVNATTMFKHLKRDMIVPN